MADKTKQKAKDGANQFSAESVDSVCQMQVGTMNMYTGLTVADCINICNQVFLSHAKEYTEEAVETAMQRSQVFSNDVVNRLSIVENALEEFKKPEFQSLLVKAQKTATRTSKMDDYKLLSELIAQKVEKKDNKKIGTGINKAVDIIDELDDDSLLSLTVLCAVTSYTPITGITKDYMNVLDDLYKKVLYGTLPKSYDWMDQLDILDCVRVSSLEFRDFYDYIMGKSSGVFCLGIEKNSPNYTTCINILKSVSLPVNILIDNELESNYVRLPVMNKNSIKNFISNGISLNNAQISALEQIYDMYSKDNTKMTAMKKNAESILDTYNYIKMIKDWWKKCPNAMDLTIVGKTIAYSNLSRIDPTLPKIY